MILSPAVGAFAQTDAAGTEDGVAGSEVIQVESNEDVSAPPSVDNAAEQESGTPTDEAVIQEEELGGNADEAVPAEEDAEEEINGSELTTQEPKAAEGTDDEEELFGEECDHAKTYEYTWFREILSVEDDPDDHAQHFATGMQCHYVVCMDCGEILSEVELGMITEKVSHSYDEDGVCIECGHSNACQHEDSYSYDSLDWGTVTIEEIEGDDQVHRATGIAYRYTYCNDCYLMLSSEYLGESTEEYAHNYDENGVCEDCGHSNACQHENAYSYTENEWENAVFEEIDGNNSEHQVTAPAREVTNCADCWARLSEESIGPVTELYSHSYNDEGVCVECGHVNNCTHQHTDYYYGSGEETYEEIEGDDRYHNSIAEREKVTYCEDCGLDLESEDLGVIARKEGHFYDENGICYGCGHHNQCRHPSTYEEIWITSEDCTYEAVDDMYHSVHGERARTVYCEECDMELESEELDIGDVLEEHCYDEDGVCEECGHVNTCTHEHQDTYYEFDEYNNYEPIDEKEHKVTGYIALITYCKDCGEELELEEIREVTEDHEMRNGVCDLCGYEEEQEPSENWREDEAGNRYYYDDDGRMAVGWKNISDSWYYFNGRGVMQTRWQKLGGVWYYFDPETGIMTSEDWAQDGETWYYFDKSGAMHTGWLSKDDYWFYLGSNGAKVFGWQQISGKWYYFETDYGLGFMVTGWEQIGGTWYHFADNGAMQTGWVSDGDDWYYFSSSGAQVYGWQKIGGVWYYFEPEDQIGYMVTGWKKIGANWYHFSAGGAMQTGWQLLGGDWYYFNSSGAQVFGWMKSGSTWYYFDPIDEEGNMVTGWKKIGGSWYHFADSGAMQTGWQQFGGIWYYFNSSGTQYFGWLNQGGKWYYLNPDYEYGDMLIGLWDISGTTYYFNSSGVMTTGWVKLGYDWYYFGPSGAMVTGWLKIGTSWYYLDGDGVMLTGTWIIDGQQYTFDPSGVWIR